MTLVCKNFEIDEINQKNIIDFEYKAFMKNRLEKEIEEILEKKIF